jgi:acyl dehydratase
MSTFAWLIAEVGKRLMLKAPVDWPDLSERPVVSLADLKKSVGSETASLWVTVDQNMINAFADATGDDAFIHTDPERAQRTRFRGTIAHGLLTLSVLPWLMRSATPLLAEIRMGVNYGYDKVRFVTPVPCGARIRGRFTL